MSYFQYPTAAVKIYCAVWVNKVPTLAQIKEVLPTFCGYLSRTKDAIFTETCFEAVLRLPRDEKTIAKHLPNKGKQKLTFLGGPIVFVAIIMKFLGRFFNSANMHWMHCTPPLFPGSKFTVKSAKLDRILKMS